MGCAWCIILKPEIEIPVRLRSAVRWYYRNERQEGWQSVAYNTCPIGMTLLIYPRSVMAGWNTSEVLRFAWEILRWTSDSIFCPSFWRWSDRSRVLISDGRCAGDSFNLGGKCLAPEDLIGRKSLGTPDSIVRSILWLINNVRLMDSLALIGYPWDPQNITISNKETCTDLIVVIALWTQIQINYK